MLAKDPTSFAVTIVVSHGEGSARILLGGDVDMGIRAELEAAVDGVRQAHARTVIVDLAAVSFAGSVLAHFLADLSNVMPAASISVRHASPIVEHVLIATGFGALLSPPSAPDRLSFGRESGHPVH